MASKNKKSNKLKRIAILSVSDYSNIGNRLQAYSLQKLIKNMGGTSVSVDFYRFSFYFILNKFINLSLKLFSGTLSLKKQFNIFKSKKNLKIFSDKFIKSKKYLSIKDFHNNFFYDFDKIIVGSDVVWQPLNPLPISLRFLDFLPKKYKYSYAASLGEQKIPFFLIKRYKLSLEKFKYISTREPLEKSINSFKYSVDLDPTFLLKKTDWIKLERKPDFIKDGEKYIFYFILDGSNKNKNKEYISNSDDSCKNIYAVDHDIGPSEFLYLIKNSRFIVTDSYHAVIFSIIFRKSFFSIRRSDIGSQSNRRITHILNILKLNKRHKDNLSNITSFEFLNYDRDFDVTLNKLIRNSTIRLKKIVNE